MEVLDFAPFRGSYVREFELSHSNLVNRIIKITHAHNLHVKIGRGSTSVSTVLRKSVAFFIKNIFLIIKNTFQFENWPISCLNDSETQERVVKEKNPKNFLGEPVPGPR